MNWLWPVLSAKQWLTIGVAIVMTALAAGSYGALHDQITYSISEEYFTAMKFRQFNTEQWPIPARMRAAAVGFLGSWWLGAAIGLVFSRIVIASLPKAVACIQFAVAVGIVLGTSAIFGLLGGLRVQLATENARAELLSQWGDYQIIYDLLDLPSFVQVAEIHRASYLGVAVGVALAVAYLILLICRITKPRLQMQ